MAEHVCTRKCLRWSTGFGRRFYYCALSPVVVVKVPRIADDWRRSGAGRRGCS
jgi:hypothetical protein